jgi:K+-sensing histidine kinase KdpD
MQIDNTISKGSKVALIISGLIMLAFFSVQTCVVFGFCKPSIGIAYFGYLCILAFTPPFGYVVREFLIKKASTEKELDKKNIYLEHAAKIIRHDMHSGINTYIPRGISSLTRRLTDEVIEDLKLGAPLKLLTEGLKHAQKVYSGVYEFTNLVKQGETLNKKGCNVHDILKDYLDLTSYKDQVVISEDLPTLEVNEPLFCTAVDNLIRNGLKYNDSPTKFVKIYCEGSDIIIEDNGRGITNDEFVELSKPYKRKDGQKESGTGLGLNICIAILGEHKFTVTAEKLDNGTKIKIKTEA